MGRGCTDLQVVNVGSAVVNHAARSGVCARASALPRESGRKARALAAPPLERSSFSSSVSQPLRLLSTQHSQDHCSARMEHDQPTNNQLQQQQPAEQREEDGPEFLTEDDVLEVEEFDEQGDLPMDEDDDEDGDHDGDAEGAEGQEQGDDAIDMLDGGLDDSVAVTSLHRSENGAVFCLAVHPHAATIAVSGGEDDNAFVFRTDTGAQIAQLSGHQDSVTSAAWNFDGSLVATGGMDGRVRVWKARRPSSDVAWEETGWEFLVGLEGPDEVNVRSNLGPLPL